MSTDDLSGLVSDAGRLGAHVAAVLLRRMEEGESLPWVRLPRSEGDKKLDEVGLKITRYSLDTGEAIVRIHRIDTSKVSDPKLLTQLKDVNTFQLEVDREGEQIAFSGTPDKRAPVARLFDIVVRTAEQRRQAYRREFLQELGP